MLIYKYRGGDFLADRILSLFTNANPGPCFIEFFVNIKYTYHNFQEQQQILFSLPVPSHLLPINIQN